MTVGPKGIGFVASDQTSGRLIHIQLVPNDLLHFRLCIESVPFRCTLETNSIHAVFHQFCCYRYPFFRHLVPNHG